jgi:hypothetical protein
MNKFFRYAKDIPIWYAKVIVVAVLAVVAVVMLSSARADTAVYQHFARMVAKDYHIDPTLFQAVGVIESRYQPDARGAAGEIGMFQIKPNTVLMVTGGRNPYADVQRTFYFGMKGPEIVKIQEALNERGSNLNVDGVFGGNTDGAVRHYQRANGLAEDGVVGAKTLSALSLHGLGGVTLENALKDPYTNAIWAAEIFAWCRNYLKRDEHGVLLACYNQGPGSDAVRYMKRVFDEMDRINGVVK